MSNKLMQSEQYSTRISSVLALHKVANMKYRGKDELSKLASEIERDTLLFRQPAIALQYSAFADLLGIAAQLVEWRNATLGAEIDVDRFLRAAAAKAELWLREYGSSQGLRALSQVASFVANISAITEVGEYCLKLASVPLAIGLFESEAPRIMSSQYRVENDMPPPPPELEVAFITFKIDDSPAFEVHYVSPGVVHDLEVELRVSRWPSGATTLELNPVSIELPSTYELPNFSFTRPDGEPPFLIRKKGRAVLKMPQSIGARPYEFKYAASFEPYEVEQPIAVVGQRTLRLEGIDVTKSPITGYPGVDRKLIELRDQLRSAPRVPESEVRDALTVLSTLSSLSARALQDSIFKGVASESEFQIVVRNEMRKDPSIGVELEEHPHVGGGITDLSFRGIRIELKVENDRQLSLVDCERFAQQTQSYVVSSGRKIGVLCVLDSSNKISAPFPAEDGLAVIKCNQAGSPVFVVVVLIQGNLRRPSDFSKTPKNK